MAPSLVRVLATLLTALAVLLPAGAHAETVVTEDAAGDAQAWTDDQEFQFVPAPDEASVDVVSTAASYSRNRLSVAVHLRDLEVRPRHETRLRIWTPGETFDVTAVRRSARRVTVSLTRPRGEELRCRRLSAVYDGAADTVALSLPARCIGSPRWVRLGVLTSAAPAPDADSPGTVFFVADDAHRGGVRENSVGKGPKVRRG